MLDSKTQFYSESGRPARVKSATSDKAIFSSTFFQLRDSSL